jgi:hypothetical protein
VAKRSIAETDEDEQFSEEEDALREKLRELTRKKEAKARRVTVTREEEMELPIAESIFTDLVPEKASPKRSLYEIAESGFAPRQVQTEDDDMKEVLAQLTTAIEEQEELNQGTESSSSNSASLNALRIE